MNVFVIFDIYPQLMCFLLEALIDLRNISNCFLSFPVNPLPENSHRSLYPRLPTIHLHLSILSLHSILLYLLHFSNSVEINV